MSDKTDVPVDCNIAVAKEVVSDDATTSNAQNACVDADKICSNLKDNLETNETQVPDVSPDIQLSMNTADNSPGLDVESSVVCDSSNDLDLVVESIENINFEDRTDIELSSPDDLNRPGEEMEKTDVSDDGSDYKDAGIIKESGLDGSDSESHAGSESSTEAVRTGRRNRRPSNEVLKDNYSDDDSIEKEEGDYEPQGARESGDGEEKIKDKPVDRDEDKKDPQYIPKKGIFYEHDDRTADSGPANTAEEPKETKKKKFVADKIDRWGHDMFDNTKQSPKSAQDLIDYYGYDIRNEDEPPKAWRSRRYGRGPNKYTRQWQDEAAYRNKRPQSNKPPPPPAPFKNNIEDFPTVEQSKSGYRRVKNKGFNNPKDSGNRGTPHSKTQVPREPRSDSRKKTQSENSSLNSPSSAAQSSPTDRSPPTRDNKFKDMQIEKTVFLNKKKPFSTAKTKSEAEAEADLAALSKEFSNAVINLGRDGKILPIGSNTSISSGSGSCSSSNNNNNNIMPTNINVSKVEKTGMKDMDPQGIMHVSNPEVRVKERRETGQSGVGSSKSKRYSSQRQRSLPQSNHLQQQQQQPQQQQQFLHQQQFYQPPPPPPPSAPETVPDSAIFSGFQGNPPPPVYTDSMQGVVFLPGYPPTPPPHLLNYCPAPQQYGMPPPLGPPPDIFPTQPQGITYYSPQSQVQPRPPASRRVKVAIPIVAPPEQQPQSDQTCS